MIYERKLTGELNQWKTSSSRKPLILRGARQVGKTTLIGMFAAGFDFFINLDLNKNEDKQIFEKNDNITTIIQILFLKANISPGSDAKVLIFLDEIQNSPGAIKLLRYFYEQASHLYIIAAGFLLESILDNQISFPVGRVEYLILRPFSFEEYLMAHQEDSVLKIYKKLPFPVYGHKKLMALFVEYALIGGMPEVVKHYLENKDIVAVGRIFENLITGYSDDVEKYAKNDHQQKIIRHIIHNAIRLAGERIKFEGFASSNYKSKDIGEGFRILEKTFLLSLVYPTTNTKIPVIENKRKSPKLHILDTGILNYFAGVQLMILNNGLLDTVFEGRIAEHIVGQELLSLKSNVSAKNHFWIKEKKQSNAEVDYVLQIDDLLIPVEVKLGKTGRLRSLMEFIDLCPHHFAVRIYSGELKVETAKTLKGKEFTLLNLPFYLTAKAPDYIKMYLNGPH